MKISLISCENCSIVLNENTLNFSDDMYDEYDEIDDDLAEWDGDEYVPKVKCPFCGESILKTK